ncbi:hypothetical protein HPB47_003655 [Ixodes persulcatus]|uniref:Uncharacterized protein n=1 Tax=Ixodes persulcatus TaxID=34615 RepID=A0AC60PIW7_IXOPE|nr:hypothetical protein HPB47_003655 [Ixodes persulcatus]
MARCGRKVESEDLACRGRCKPDARPGAHEESGCAVYGCRRRPDWGFLRAGHLGEAREGSPGQDAYRCHECASTEGRNVAENQLWLHRVPVEELSRATQEGTCTSGPVGTRHRPSPLRFPAVGAAVAALASGGHFRSSRSYFRRSPQHNMWPWAACDPRALSVLPADMALQDVLKTATGALMPVFEVVLEVVIEVVLDVVL